MSITLRERELLDRIKREGFSITFTVRGEYVVAIANHCLAGYKPFGLCGGGETVEAAAEELGRKYPSMAAMHLAREDFGRLA